MKTIVISLAILATLTLVGTAYAQEQNLTKVIEDMFTRPSPYDEDPFTPDFNYSNVDVLFESPKTIILYGELIVERGLYNTELWQAMDIIKNEGYKLTQTIHDGVGSEGNPGRAYLIMEK